MGHHYKFVQNKECEFFPCHQGVKEEEFNCLFCYCPLYTLKDQCGGNPTFLEDGLKDCSSCTITHKKDVGYDHVMKKIMDILELGRKQQ